MIDTLLREECVVETPLVAGPTLQIGDGLTLRLLGLHLEADGEEVYEVALRTATDAAWCEGRLEYVSEGAWTLVDGQGARRGPLTLGLPDDVFAQAMGEPALTTEAVARATPHWPSAVHARLAGRRASGASTIAFDGGWFLARLTGSDIDRPLLLPGGAVTLGLEGLVGASEVVSAAAGLAGEHGVLGVLQRGLEAPSSGAEAAWRGDGRLIGESTWGELCQVGEDIAEGCQAALGSGPLRVTFDPDEPMGLGFGPEVPSADVAAGREPSADASAGTGVEVGVVEPGGAAEAAGVTAGMGVTGLSPPSLDVDGRVMPFEDILDAIDARREARAPLVMTFDTAAPFGHWYAVEMPAAATLAALANATGAAGAMQSGDAGVGAAFDTLCGRELLWREPTPRLFLGAPGSVTCAHVDICPQVQLAHALHGVKVLGVASHGATARLGAEHVGTEDDEGAVDEGATYVPTDRPLSARQARLLGDAEVSLVWLQAGDLAVLHSGALHFASNGAEGLGASLYHGVITPAAVPRLRAAAAAGGAVHEADDPYAGHLFAADLWALVERQLLADGQAP